MNTLAEGLVRRWVALYTRGLPASVRDRRRDEIDSDLWSHREAAPETGQSSTALAVEIVTRLVLGMPADIGWRLEQHDRHPARKPIERSATMGSRIVALLAIGGGIASSTVMAWFLTTPLAPGDPPWAVFRDPGLGSAMSPLGLLGMLALVAATGGLGLLVGDRLHPGVAALVAIGTIGGAMGLIGGYAGLLVLPVASAALLVSLGRLGFVSWWLAVTHLVGAIGFVTAMAAALGTHPTSIANPVFLLYPLTWIAVGLVVLRGLPSSPPRPQAAG